MVDPSPLAAPSGQGGQQGMTADQMLASIAGSLNSASTSDKPSLARNYGPVPTLGRSESASSGSVMYTNPLSKPDWYTVAVNDLALQYYGWSEKEKNQLRSKLGLLNKNFLTATDDDIAKTWADYVQQSANNFSAGVSVSPMDLIDKDVKTKGVGASQAGTKTTTTRDVSLTSAPDADAIFNSAAKSLLGRAPTQAEYAQFQASLNEAERNSPVVATTTSTTDDEGNVVSQSRTSSGGIGSGGAQMMAQKQAQQNPEYGAYQAATTYWDAAMQMIQRGY